MYSFTTKKGRKGWERAAYVCVGCPRRARSWVGVEKQIWQAAPDSREVKIVGGGADNQVAGVRQLDR